MDRNAMLMNMSIITKNAKFKAFRYYIDINEGSHFHIPSFPSQPPIILPEKSRLLSSLKGCNKDTFRNQVVS